MRAWTRNNDHRFRRLPRQPTTKLEHALKTAISAAHNAERYGTELGTSCASTPMRSKAWPSPF